MGLAKRVSCTSRHCDVHHKCSKGPLAQASRHLCGAGTDPSSIAFPRGLPPPRIPGRVRGAAALWNFRDPGGLSAPGHSEIHGPFSAIAGLNGDECGGGRGGARLPGSREVRGAAGPT